MMKKLVEHYFTGLEQTEPPVLCDPHKRCASFFSVLNVPKISRLSLCNNFYDCDRKFYIAFVLLVVIPIK